jgi:hypothetical protein
VKRLKWVDDNTIALAYTSVGQGDAKQDVGIVRAEVITCLSSILQSLLSKQVIGPESLQSSFIFYGPFTLRFFTRKLSLHTNNMSLSPPSSSPE